MIEIEKMGKPAVPIVSGRFAEDAIASARAFAMPDLKFVIVPRIYRNLATEACIRQTELAIDGLVQSPWEPFHVDRGFTREASAISILCHLWGSRRSRPGKHDRRRVTENHRLWLYIRHP
ncbi:hypothetical protein NKDENANG_03535 [Candidatus Entotheonellaceae bacterium PAL068K]